MQRLMSMIIPSNVEAGTELHNRLGITLNIVEEGHKNREGICDGVRMTVVIEDINHFKTFSMEAGTSILKQEAEPPILDGNAKPALPITTGLSVGRVSDQFVIRLAGAVFVRPKVEINFILHVQITLDVLDFGSLKGSAGRREGLAGGMADEEEEEELAGAGNGEGAVAMGGAGVTDEGQPDRVRSEAEEVE